MTRPAREQAGAVGVIPARWASKRFPGKMLAPLGGRPLVVRVLERAQRAARLGDVLVATDDVRIGDAVTAAGGHAVMTRADHPSGTDRIAEAVAGREADIVVNIQGDEPLLDPALVDRLVAAMEEDTGWDMATAAVPIESAEELHSPHIVKVVADRAGRALYFSRSVIPFVRDSAADHRQEPSLHWRHLGLYAYRRAFLQELVRTPPCALEEAERLEQLRALYLGARMKVITAAASGIGVDTPADLERAEQALRRELAGQGRGR